MMEAQRITIAIRDNTINILTSDLARANIKTVKQDEEIAELKQQVESLTPKPAEAPK